MEIFENFEVIIVDWRNVFSYVTEKSIFLTHLLVLSTLKEMFTIVQHVD